MSPVTDAMIPVGGLGTRLLPATRSQPKEMLPVVDKPVVQYVVEELVRAGVGRVLLVTGRRKRAIEDHFDAEPELGAAPLIDPGTGLRLLYIRQAHPLGLGDAVRYGEGFAEDRGIVVALGDTIIARRGRRSPRIVSRLIDAYERSGASAALAVQEVPQEAVSRYGIVVPGSRATADAPDDILHVAEMVEKPDPGQVSSRLAVAARYVIGPAVFAALRQTSPDMSGEVQLTDALNSVIRDGGRVVAVALADDERRHDIGTIESYCEVFLEHALEDPRFGPALRERLASLLAAGA